MSCPSTPRGMTVSKTATRLVLAASAAILILSLWPGALLAQTRVHMSGEHYVYATGFVNRNFTGWSENGSQTEDAFSIWQRLRLRSDFESGEHMAMSLWLQVDNTPWGNGCLTVDNPAVSVQVYQAFLKFTVPDTAVDVFVGKFTTTLPQSGGFSGSMVLDSEYPSLTLRAPLSESVELVASYGRPLGYGNALENVSADPRGNFDLAYMSLAVNTPEFSFTPWAGLGLFMSDGASTPSLGAGGAPDLDYIRRQMFSLGYFTGVPGYRGATVPYFWAGASLKALLGQFNLYADAVGGAAGTGEAAKNRRAGFQADAALEYSGLSWATPQVFGWWASGEDADIKNGSERLPTVVRTWNPCVSYLFSTGQIYDNTTSIDADPTGSWGAGFALDKISLVDDLSSRITAVYMRGLSDPAPLRRSVAVSGPGAMVAMGKNLTVNESLLGFTFDHTYTLFPGFDLVVETGWAHPMGLEKSVWGSRFVDAASDSWKVAAGFHYQF